MVFLGAALFTLPLNPLIAVIRVFYPEHRDGVNRGRYLQLWWFFMRHPIAVQGEGPSNGDGLAALGASASAIYPVTPANLEKGPLKGAYWLKKDVGKPTL